MERGYGQSALYPSGLSFQSQWPYRIWRYGILYIDNRIEILW